MTMQVVDEGDLLAYLAEDERAGGRIPITLGPFAVITMIGALQLASRHPEMSDTQRELLRGVVDQLRVPFIGTLGEKVIEMGENPEFDR
jgi:hypothetical protein